MVAQLRAARNESDESQLHPSLGIHHMINRKNGRRQFRFENLERRCMLDGNITTSFANGVLAIIGDNFSNGLVISAPSNGVIKLTGLMQNGLATTINGSSSVQGTGVTSIILDFNNGETGVNEGNDTIIITHLTISGSISISTGDGDDIIGIGDYDNTSGAVETSVNSLLGAVNVGQGFTISMQRGNNLLYARDVTSQTPGANFTASGFDGVDTMTLVNASIIHEVSFADIGQAILTFNNVTTKNLALSTGVGNDQVLLENSTVSVSAILNTGFGNDSVDLENTNVGSLSSLLGPGDDQFTANHVSISGPTTIDGGKDNDTVDFGNVSAMNLNVFLFTGDDQLTLNHVTAKVATLNGGDGNDTLNVTDLTCTQCFVNGGNGNDQLNLTSIDVTVKGFNVDAGAGNDSVALNGINAAKLNVVLNYGTDSISVQNATIAGAASYFGGPGFDTFTDLGGNTFGSVSHVRFESFVG